MKRFLYLATLALVASLLVAPAAAADQHMMTNQGQMMDQDQMNQMIAGPDNGPGPDEPDDEPAPDAAALAWDRRPIAGRVGALVRPYPARGLGLSGGVRYSEAHK